MICERRVETERSAAQVTTIVSAGHLNTTEIYRAGMRLADGQGTGRRLLPADREGNQVPAWWAGMVTPGPWLVSESRYHCLIAGALG